MKIGRTTAGVLGLVLLMGCGQGGDFGSDRPGPIILISIDTLRSDRLPAYGYSGVETPAIDSLRREGILFERAYSPMPLTLPAHASLLTGLQPPGHGVRINMGYSLSEDTPTLAGLLRANGFATGAAVSSFVLREETGIAAGFDFFEDEIEYRAGIGPEGLQRDGGSTLGAARSWLDSVAGGPFFLFLHFYEPHQPFLPPEPWASRYPSAYDGEIAAVDAVVGQVADELRRLGIYEASTIILTSDHGEGLGDHGESEHGILLYRESLQVPLIVKLPNGSRAGEIVPDPVQLVDVMPTVLALAGVDSPTGLDGVSLLGHLKGDPQSRPVYSESYYPRLYFGWSELTSWIDGRFHYIHSPEPELYDLVTDPGETENLISAGTVPHLGRMVEELGAVDRRFQGPEEVDLETRRRLESLGYIGGTRTDAPGALLSPSSQIHLLRELEQAAQAYGRGEDRNAVDSLDRILAENPQMVMAWEMKARSLRRLGRLPEALEAYRQTLRLASEAPHVALEAARLAAMLGLFDETRALARTSEAWDPVAAHLLIAQVEINTGNLERAREEAAAALAADPTSAKSLVLVAQVDLAQGAFEQGLASVDKAAGLAPTEPVRGLHLVRGNLLLQLDRTDEAEAAFRREIAAFPRDPRAYSRLALLYGATGRGDRAVQTIDELLAQRPALPGVAMAIQTLAAAGEQAAAERIYLETRQKLDDPGRLDQILGVRSGG